MKLRIPKFYDILEYIIAFLAIIECNTVYSTSVAFPKNAFYIIFMLPVILLTTMNLLRRKNKGFYNLNSLAVSFFLSYVLFFLLLFSIAFNPTSLIFRLGIVAPIIFILYSSEPLNRTKFTILYKISDIIFYFACISLICWLLITLLHILPLNSSILINWGSIRSVRGFFGIYFETQASGNLPRNSGIFAEGPMYNFILCLCLTVESLFKRDKKKIKILIFIITIISTLTTTGSLFLIMWMGVILFLNKRKGKIIRLLRILLFPIILSIVIYLCYIVIQNKKNTSSYEVRSSKIIASYKLWIKSPMLGAGYGKSTVGNSNSLFLILGDGGVVLAFFYIIPFLLIPWINTLLKKSKNYLIASSLIFVIFCFTVIYNNIITYLYIGMWYSLIINKRNNINFL